MITAFEIEEKSREFEIHTSNVQRDYVFGWFISGIFTVSSLKDSIFLKGGNALRKGYFANTRFSADLDFGIPGNIARNTLLNEINKVSDFIQEKAAIIFVKEQNRVEEKFAASEAPIPGLKVYEARIYFKDFYGNSDHMRLRISLDLTRFDKVLLPIQTVSLIHPYSDAAELQGQIGCMKLEEIVATKLKCLLQRQHAPDLFDYVYSIKLLGGGINKNELVKAFVKKTIFSRNPHIAKRILLQMPFDYFREYWNKTLVCAKQIIFGVEEAIHFFLSDLESLFGIYPNNGYSQFAFFGPELRVPIMKAGREQTLLKIKYNGAQRLVEPYSLKYLEKRSGQEREYFYVFNRSGGSNPPGIRSLIATGFQSIENTNERFTPQFPIELSKAGDLPEKPYLFDPNKPVPAPRGRRTTSFGPKYIYHCSFCGKEFIRSSHNSILRSHKNKRGYPCNGRYGIYVTTRY